MRTLSTTGAHATGQEQVPNHGPKTSPTFNSSAGIPVHKAVLHGEIAALLDATVMNS
jgi:hypothetical protein